MMFKVRYLAPTAGGGLREHQLDLDSYSEFKAFLEKSDNFGYEVVANPMCDGCIWLDCKCEGSLNHVYTGCNNKLLEGAFQ